MEGIFHEVCRILAPWPGIQTVFPPVETQSPNHWATREFPSIFFSFLFSVKNNIHYWGKKHTEGKIISHDPITRHSPLASG